MKSLWNDADAKAAIDRWVSAGSEGADVNEDIALRTYTSRLIGSEPKLVLHGGGNTSVKTRLVDDTGETVDVLCVKGSGWDLGDIEPPGLPAVRLASLGALRSRASLSDEAMVSAQRTRLLDASSPNPSVEALLHAFLPAKFIDHSHADAILALVDQPDAEAICAQVFGDTLAVVPYVMPGFALSKLAAEVQERFPNAEGLLLLKHGLFTWGDTAKESYERHITAVTKAEDAIAAASAGSDVKRITRVAIDWTTLAPLVRGALTRSTGNPWLLHLRTSEGVERYLEREDLSDVSQRGTPTPDHVIRTKRVPMILDFAGLEGAAIHTHIEERLSEYRASYEAYVTRESAAKGRSVTALDANPRVILVPGLGIVSVATSMSAAHVAADLHEHCIDVIEAAEAIGTYEVLPEGDVFDMEYWSLEQAKLGKKASRLLEGSVVYISGAASGIGAATAQRFAAEGANLFLVDQNAECVAALGAKLGMPSMSIDVANPDEVRASVDACVRHYGGLDGVISNAGYAPQGAMHEVDDETLRRSFEVNFFAHQTLAAAATRVLRAQGTGGYLLFNASKAAFNPGKDFGPYALPKAALIALMKQYAVENGEVGIRSGAINADRVRTGLLPPDFVKERAAARGLSPDAYFRSNLLNQEVTAADCAAAFLHLACARSTTGCVLTVDGGNIAASPR